MCERPFKCPVETNVSRKSKTFVAAADFALRCHECLHPTSSVLGSSRLGCTVRACAEHDFGSCDHGDKH